MNSLESNDSMADFMRLQNLKSLALNRLRGRADNEFADMQNPDLKGTAIPPYALDAPQGVPGNFDVRANMRIETPDEMPEPEIAPPPMQQGPASNDAGIWSKLMNLSSSVGRGMSRAPESSYLVPPAPQMDEQASMQQSNVMGDLSNGLNGMMNPPQEITEPAMPLTESLEQQIQEEPPTEPFEPGSQAQPGSVVQVMQDPSLKSKIDEIFGPIDPAMAESATTYENAMNAYSQNLDDVTARLTEQEKAIRQRIEARNLSTQDKILMGLALIAPLIIGGIMGGKEGLVGGIGGSAKALAASLGAQEKEQKKEVEDLSTLALDKAKIAKERAGIEPLTAEFKRKLAESIPNKELRAIFAKDGELIGDKLLINSGNENLPIKADAIRDVNDYKRIKAEIPKFASSLASTEQSMKVIDSMHSLLDAANQSVGNKNLLQKGLSFIPMYDSVTGLMKAFIPYTRDTVRDEEGNEYKISELYNSYRTQLSDLFRKSSGQNSKAFKATEEHFFNQLPNPFGRTGFLEGKSDINQNKKQLDFVKDKFSGDLVKSLEEQGIDTSRIAEKLKMTGRNVELSEKSRKRDRVNQAVEQSTRGN